MVASSAQQGQMYGHTKLVAISGCGNTFFVRFMCACASYYNFFEGFSVCFVDVQRGGK